MTDRQLYRFFQGVAIVLFIVQSMLTAALGPLAEDLGLTRFGIAVMALFNVGIGAALIYLPAVNKQPMNRRGDSTDG
jgi:hypothetical protein